MYNSSNIIQYYPISEASLALLKPNLNTSILSEKLFESNIPDNIQCDRPLKSRKLRIMVTQGWERWVETLELDDSSPTVRSGSGNLEHRYLLSLRIGLVSMKKHQTQEKHICSLDVCAWCCLHFPACTRRWGFSGVVKGLEGEDWRSRIGGEPENLSWFF